MGQPEPVTEEEASSEGTCTHGRMDVRFGQTVPKTGFLLFDEVRKKWDSYNPVRKFPKILFYAKRVYRVVIPNVNFRVVCWKIEIES